MPFTVQQYIFDIKQKKSYWQDVFMSTKLFYKEAVAEYKELCSDFPKERFRLIQTTMRVILDSQDKSNKTHTDQND